MVRSLMFAIVAAACAAASAANHNWSKVDLREIKVRGEIGRRVDLTVYGNLLKIELEKQFLDHFRTKERKGDSVGTGKLVEYAARFAAYTRDPEVMKLKKYVVDELLKTQGEDGYIGCLREDSRLWGYWDLAETGFIILGLCVDHRYFGEKRSLEAARRAADYIMDNWKTMPDGWEDAYISGTAAAVGLCWGMEALYGETGDRRYIDFCNRERMLDSWYAPVTVGRRWGLHGHSATHLYQAIVQLELESVPTSALRRVADETAAFMLDGDGTLISGACGLWECWTNDQSGRPATGETCSTAFQMRLWDLLIQCSENPCARWGDAIERTMYNALFAAQSKDGRKIRYYIPLEGERLYYPSDTYCCPNNFRRIMSELPEYLFYKRGNTLFANLYSECDLETSLECGKVRIEERTAYPTKSRIEFAVTPESASTFDFALRIPAWCESPALFVDGDRVEVRPGTVAKIRREWKGTTKVVLDLPMQVKAVAGRKRQSGRAAFMRGPVLYALDPTQNGKIGKPTHAAAESHVLTAEEQRAANLGRFFSNDPASYCGEMVVDSSSAKLVSDDSVRPDGTALEVRASTSGHAVGVTAANGKTIRLTEFPDCEATATYFRILDHSLAVEDELFTGNALLRGVKNPSAAGTEVKPTGCPDFVVESPRRNEGRVVNAADFGFSVDSDKNASAINRALAEAKKVGASRLELAPGTYRCFDEQGVVISGMKDFTFDGKGAVLVFRRPAEFRAQPQSELVHDKGNLLVSGCERCVVGNFVMDWDWQGDPLAAFVRVVAKHVDEARSEGSYVDLEFVDYDRYPKYPNPVPVQKMTAMDECRTRFRVAKAFSFGQTEGHFGAKNEWVSPNVLRVWPGIAMEGRNQNHDTGFGSNPAFNAARVREMEEGGLYRLHHCYYGKNGVNLLGNRHLLLRDVTVWSCFGMGMVVDGPQKFWQVERFRVVPPTKEEIAAAYPGEKFRPRPVTSTSDGHHVARSSGMCRYIGCVWKLNNDDAFNIHDRFTIAVKVSERDLQIINRRGPKYFRAEKGALLELRNADFSSTGFKARLVGSTGDYGGRSVLTLDRPIPDMKSACFLVWDRTYGSDGVHLKDCLFEDSGYRNLFSPSDVTIEDCVFRRTGNVPVRFIADYRQTHWCEGMGATNLVVRNCLFEDASAMDPDAPLISTCCVTPKGWDVGKVDPGFVGGGMLIEGNRFVRPRGAVLDLECGSGVVFRNNVVDLNGVDLQKWPKAGSVRVSPDVVGFREDGTSRIP